MTDTPTPAKRPTNVRAVVAAWTIMLACALAYVMWTVASIARVSGGPLPETIARDARRDLDVCLVYCDSMGGVLVEVRRESTGAGTAQVTASCTCMVGADPE